METVKDRTFSPLDDSTMARRQQATPPIWLGRTHWRLFWDAWWGGGPWLARIVRFLEIPHSLISPERVKWRFERLKQLGYIDVIPTLPQVLVAGRDQII